MDKKELLKLADRYQAKADRDYEVYQDTGETKRYSSYYKNAELADALRMAADAADEHQSYIVLRGAMSDFAQKALEASRAALDVREKLRVSLERDLIAYGRSSGLIGGE